MISKVIQKLPSPVDSDSKGVEFEKFIKNLTLNICENPALSVYQGTSTDDFSYVTAEQLNHSLNLLKYGEDSLYSRLAHDQLGSELDDHLYKKSLREMDSLFHGQGYSFTNDSILYKGVSDSVPFYKILDLKSCKVGDEIVFHGYLSTSVSKKKASDFVRGGVLLVIAGLENSHSIIPKNAAILNSPTSKHYEQEVLLNRGTKIVVSATSENIMGFIEIECKIFK